MRRDETSDILCTQNICIVWGLLKRVQDEDLEKEMRRPLPVK